MSTAISSEEKEGISVSLTKIIAFSATISSDNSIIASPFKLPLKKSDLGIANEKRKRKVEPMVKPLHSWKIANTFNVIDLAITFRQKILPPFCKDKQIRIGHFGQHMSLGRLIRAVPASTVTDIDRKVVTTYKDVSIDGIPFKQSRHCTIAEQNGYIILIGSNGYVMFEGGAYLVLTSPLSLITHENDVMEVDGSGKMIRLGKGSHMIVFTRETGCYLIIGNGGFRFDGIWHNDSVKRTHYEYSTEELKYKKLKTAHENGILNTLFRNMSLKGSFHFNFLEKCLNSA